MPKKHTNSGKKRSISLDLLAAKLGEQRSCEIPASPLYAVLGCEDFGEIEKLRTVNLRNGKRQTWQRFTITSADLVETGND